MEVTSLREPKMADRVATVLRRMFIRGEITEGTMLPPESELMERFGVSRPTLREAFRVLESESLIQVQRGVRGGARVTRPRRETLARYAGLILEYEGVTVKDVYDARVTLEVPMVEQLAKDRNPKVIAELEQIVERESQLNPGSDAVDQLTDFHAAIARLSGNATLQIVSDMLHHIIEKANRSLQPTKGDPRRAGGPPLGEDPPDGAGHDQGRRRREGRRALEASSPKGRGVRPVGLRIVHCRRPSRMTEARQSRHIERARSRNARLDSGSVRHLLRRVAPGRSRCRADACRWRGFAIPSPERRRSDRWPSWSTRRPASSTTIVGAPASGRCRASCRWTSASTASGTSTAPCWPPRTHLGRWARHRWGSAR